jgi:protein ImuB
VAGLVDAEPADTLALEVGGSAHLFGGETGLLRTIDADLRRRGWTARLALADTVGAAWALVHFARRVGPGQFLAAGPPFGPHDETAPTNKNGGPALACGSLLPPYGMPPHAIIVPSGEQAAALAPLPVALLRLSPEVCTSLDDLGLSTIGHLLSLPRSTLPSRFGPDVLRRLDQALGTLTEILVPERVLEPAAARWGSEFPIEDRRTLEHVLDQLLQQVVARLQRGNLGLLELDLKWISPGRAPDGCRLRLVRPTVGRREILELVRLQWERRCFAGGVVAMSAEAVATGPLECDQLELLAGPAIQAVHQPAIHEPAPEQPAAPSVGIQTAPPARQRNVSRERDRLLNRLSSRLGREQVLKSELFPDDQPERAVVFSPVVNAAWLPRSGRAEDRAGGRAARRRKKPDRVPAAWETPIERNGYRPLELFPRPVCVRVWSVVPDGPPMRLTWRGAEQSIVQCEGPERIQTGWWRSGCAARDYYRITTEQGERLWLFRSLEEETWFIHGEF